MEIQQKVLDLQADNRSKDNLIEKLLDQVETLKQAKPNTTIILEKFIFNATALHFKQLLAEKDKEIKKMLK